MTPIRSVSYLMRPSSLDLPCLVETCILSDTDVFTILHRIVQITYCTDVPLHMTVTNWVLLFLGAAAGSPYIVFISTSGM